MAVTGVEAQIEEALLWKAGQIAAAAGLQIAYPNVAFKPKIGVAYLAATYRPNITAALTVGFRGTVDRQGLLQVSVFWPAGAGEVLAAQAAAVIAAAFKYGTRVDRNGVSVRIEQAPRVTPSSSETDWLQIPVIISWRCLIAAAA